MLVSGNDRGIMRVLVADQESDMLEALSRAFEIDVATSKATCIDLLRANDFDVIVAGERLADGSGLELLSSVGQRWPNVLRVLSIEPERRALLKGRLGPFKLFETIPWPIEDDKLEAVLMRASEALARQGVAPASPAKARPSPPQGSIAAQTADARRSAPTNRSTSQSGKYRVTTLTGRPSPDDARRTPPPGGRSSQDDARGRGARTAGTSAPLTRNAPASGQKPGARGPSYPPLPPKGSKIVPLGSPDTTEYRILPHDYHEQRMPGAPRHHDDEKKSGTLQEKAAALAAEAKAAVSAIVRYIKPQSSTRKPAKAPPRKKR